MITSNYLKKEDVDPPLRLTIESCEQQNVAPDNKEPELKWVVGFREDVKPLILNKVNINSFAESTGETDSDNWIGKQIVLFNDKSVEYQGKFGGVRVYPDLKLPPVAPPQAPPVDHQEDQIPF